VLTDKTRMSSSYWWLKEHNEGSLLRVAVFEGSTLTDGNVASSVEQVELQAKRASRDHSAHLLVFPELFLSGYKLNPEIILNAADYIIQENVIAHLQTVALQYSIALLICYPELVDDKIYNSATLINEHGDILLTYRKTHLWAEKERQIFVEGDQLSSVVEIRGVRVAVMICYDMEIGEVARALTLLGAQLILIPTALAVSPANENIVRYIVPTRAMENHVWLAYANLALPEFVGLSRIVGPDGTELCRVEKDPLIVADLIPKNYLSAIQGTPYLADRRPSLYSSINDPNYHIKLPIDYKYTDD
jgi:predicted amidohydrolase